MLDPLLEPPIPGSVEWLGSPDFIQSLTDQGISDPDYRRFEMPMIGTGEPIVFSLGSSMRRPKYGPGDVAGIVLLNDVVISEDGETAVVTLAGDRAVLDIIADYDDVTTV